jgi:hypothetical protein
LIFNSTPFLKTKYLQVATMKDVILPEFVKISILFFVESLIVKNKPGRPPISDHEDIVPLRNMLFNLPNLNLFSFNILCDPSGIFPKRYLYPSRLVNITKGWRESLVLCDIVVTVNIAVVYLAKSIYFSKKSRYDLIDLKNLGSIEWAPE